MATILTKKKDTSGAPSAGDLTNDTGGAELAVNTADKRLYTKDSGGNVVEVGTNPSTINIDAGSIDGTPIGANSASTGSFTTLNTSGAVVFNDAGADVDFRVEGDTDANLLFVDAGNDRVGVGTSSPNTKLDIFTGASFITASTDDGVGSFGGFGFNLRIASTSHDIGRINGVYTAGGGGGSGGISFSTRDAGTLAERMYINPPGNVGIGTSSPGSILELKAATPLFGINGTTANSARGITFQQNGTTYGSLTLNTNSGEMALSSGENGNAFFLTFKTDTGAEKARIDSSGHLLVACTDSNEASSVGARLINNGAIRSTRSETVNTSSTYDVYSTGASAFRFYVGMAGTVFATNTSISAISDVRHKENIRDLDVGLAEIMQLQPRVFDWKEGKGKNTQNDRGFIAQEFEQVFPDLIDEWKDPAPEGEEPYKSVRQDLIPVLVKAIQELKAELDAAKERIAALENA